MFTKIFLYSLLMMSTGKISAPQHENTPPYGGSSSSGRPYINPAKKAELARLERAAEQARLAQEAARLSELHQTNRLDVENKTVTSYTTPLLTLTASNSIQQSLVNIILDYTNKITDLKAIKTPISTQDQYSALLANIKNLLAERSHYIQDYKAILQISSNTDDIDNSSLSNQLTQLNTKIASLEEFITGLRTDTAKTAIANEIAFLLQKADTIRTAINREASVKKTDTKSRAVQTEKFVDTFQIKCGSDILTFRICI